jgi:hypothetical protein
MNTGLFPSTPPSTVRKVSSVASKPLTGTAGYNRSTAIQWSVMRILDDGYEKGLTFLKSVLQVLHLL